MTPQVPAIRALRASVGIVSSGAPHPVADARVSITATAETLAPGRSEKMEITTVPGRGSRRDPIAFSKAARSGVEFRPRAATD
jgi:hypothetical protein